MAEKTGIVEDFPTEPRPDRRHKWYSLRGKDVSYVSVDDGYYTSSETSSLNDDVVDAHHNVFEAPEAQDIYKLVEGFESAHRFQPDATWSAEEEKQLIRRVCNRVTLHNPPSFVIATDPKISLTGALRSRHA